jgi:hypothetical protein
MEQLAIRLLVNSLHDHELVATAAMPAQGCRSLIIRGVIKLSRVVKPGKPQQDMPLEIFAAFENPIFAPSGKYLTLDGSIPGSQRSSFRVCSVALRIQNMGAGDPVTCHQWSFLFSGVRPVMCTGCSALRGL